MLFAIKKQWPNAYLIDVVGTVVLHGNTIIVDENYYLPPEKDVEKLIFFRPWWKLWINPSRIPDKSDCDDWSVKYYYDVRHAYSGKDVLAYGMCGGKFPRIHPTLNHLMNFMVCQKEIVKLHDPQSGEIWTATAEDKAWFWWI
jgi:hypothetical protein